MKKIFGIGLSRTGTHSLASALNAVGVQCIHWPLSLLEIEKYPASCDISVSARFMQLDKLYPASKFILTTRDIETWLQSCQRHYREVTRCKLYQRLSEDERNFALESERLVYGRSFNPHAIKEDDNFSPEVFLRAYNQHNENVRRYFRWRRRDFLEMNIVNGDGWSKLLPFIYDGVRVQDIPFPHEGKG